MDSLYSYGLLVTLCGMVIVSDLRIRIVQKDSILYRIKDTRKNRYLYYLMGLSIPIVIFIASVTLSYEPFTRILVVVLSVEMAILWTLIQLGDGLVTKTHIGKVWYTRISQTEFYQMMTIKDQVHFAFKKVKGKRQEVLPINPEDVKPLEAILESLGVRTYASWLKEQKNI